MTALRSVFTLAVLTCALAVSMIPAADARIAEAPPSGAPAQAFAYVNEHFRRPLGLPDLSWDARIAQAAAAHAHYWVVSGYGTFHTEEPGRPGYTGHLPGDRCLAAGATAYCGEVAFSQTNLVAAAAGWLTTPFHGLPFFESQTFGCGESTAGSVCDMDALSDPLAGVPLDPSAAVNTPNATVRIWPYAGAIGVPTSWLGGESPDPLAEYTGDKRNVGPTLFVGVTAASTVTLQDANHAGVPLLAAGGASATATLPVDQGSSSDVGWTAFFPARKLKEHATYTLTVSDETGRLRSTTFTTVGKDPGLAVGFATDSYSVTVRIHAGQAGTAAVTISDAAGTKLAGRSVNVDHPWAWPGLRRGGTFVVCADLPPVGSYAPAYACERITVPASTVGLLALGPLDFHGTTAVLTLHSRGLLVGQRATIRLAADYRGSCGPRCGGWPRPRHERITFTLRATETFRLPYQSGGGWSGFVAISVPSFTVGGTHYRSTVIEKVLS